ncbi:hypothetical protein ACLMJK_006080 [Lecanora helva]
MRPNLIISSLTSAALVVAATSPSASPTPKYAPVPSEAVGPPVSKATGYRVEVFGSGAYMITDGIYQALFFVGGDSVVVVDAPPTIGHNMLKGIGTVTDLPISHLVYSHAHADHIGAAYLLNGPNTTIVAHEETLSELQQINDTNRPAPNLTFPKDFNLTVGNQTLNLSYKGPNHQPGNIFIYAPVQKTLMLVDIVFPGWVPFDQLGESQNIPGFIKAHDQILDYDFDHYIGGHLNRAGTRQDVLNQRDYVHQLYNNCAETINLSAAPPNASNPLSIQTSLASIMASDPGNQWALFDVYVEDVVAAYCANKMKEVWLGRLGGLDVYVKANAATMIASLRIDFGILGPFGVQDG